jgi:hypothetical protein
MRERVVRGEKPPLRELIRTYWYMYVKPTLSRCNALSDNTDNQYRQLVGVIVDLVRKYDLMRYRDIGFRDENESHRRLGHNDTVIVFAEKIGHLAFLFDIADRYRVNVLAFGGKPSVMMCEYFVDELRQQGTDLRRSFYIFSLVDFDPHGFIVRDSFLKNLRFYGIKNMTVIDLIHPDMLTPRETRMSRFSIPRHRKQDLELNAEWWERIAARRYKNVNYLKGTRLIRGERVPVMYGLEAESVSTKRLNIELEERMVPILGKKEDYLRTYELERVKNALDDRIIYLIKKGVI